MGAPHGGLKDADGLVSSAKLVEHRYFEIWEILIKNTKDKKNKSRYIIVLRNTFQQKCQYAKSFQRKKMSNSSSSEDEGNPNSSEGQNDTEVGIGDYVLTTSHLLLSILFRRRWRWLTWTPALMMTTMATVQPASAATAQALRRFSSFSSTKRPA